MRLKSSSERGVLEQIRRSTNAPEGAFGAVDKSGLILADAAQGAASVFLAASERRQNERDKAKVNEAVSSFIKKDSALRFDPESGLMFKSGSDAHGLYERAGNDYLKIHEEIAKGLENERQKKMYREAVTPHEQSAGIALSKHEADATRKWNLEQADDLLKTSAGALAASWRSPEGKAAAQTAARQAAVTIYGEAANGISPEDMSAKYNTSLSSKEEIAFKKWLENESKVQKRDVSMDLFNYDLRGLFKESGGFGKDGHASDKFKKPNHPTFSVESMYNGVDGNLGGSWQEENGKVSFRASDTNLKNYSPDAIKEYFNQNEPGVDLLISQEQINGAPMNKHVKDMMAVQAAHGLDIIISSEPGAAEEYINSFRSVFDDVAFNALKDKAVKAALPVKIQGDTPKLFAEFGLDGLSGALASIRENYSGAEETARISAAHSFWIEKNQERNNYEAKVYDDVYGIIRGNGSYDAVTRAISSVKWSTNAIKYQLLDLRDRKFRTGAYAEGGSGDGRVKTDRETLLNIWSMVDDKSIVQKYPTFGDFSNKFASKLSTTDLKAFRSMYDQAAGDALKIDPIRISEASTLKDILKNSGIKDELLIGAIFDRYNEEIAYRIAHPKDYKEPLTNERRIEIMKDFVADKVVGKGKYWFSDDLVVKGYQIPVGFKEDAGKPNSYTRINPDTGNTEVYVSPFQNKKTVSGGSAEGTRVIR